MTMGVVSGQILGNRWTRVLSSWGYLSVDYGVSIGIVGGRFRCFTAPVPWPISSGNLPNPHVTHRVVGYGDIWLFSPADTNYTLVPVFPL